MQADDEHGNEPVQETAKGTSIPIPTRKQVADGLAKLAKPSAKPSDDDGSPQK